VGALRFAAAAPRHWLALAALLACGCVSVSVATANTPPHEAIIAGTVPEVTICSAGSGGSGRPSVVASPVYEQCVVDDRVRLVDASGREIGQQRVHHGHFALTVSPGTYIVELLGDGTRGNPVRGSVLQRQTVTARANHASHVHFVIAVP
jgi:hypothetical protein